MHFLCFQWSPQLRTETSQLPTPCQASSEASALHFQSRQIRHPAIFGMTQSVCRDQQILQELCRESWMTISTQPHLLQRRSVPCLATPWQAYRTEVNVLQPGSGCQLVHFPWPLSTSTSNPSLAWPALTSWPRRDFCLYCYPPSHQNSFPIILLHYMVSVV